MALLDCRGCEHRTNTVFADHENLMIGEMATRLRALFGADSQPCRPRRRAIKQHHAVQPNRI